MRFDLMLTTPEEFARQDLAGVRLLFGDAGQAPPERQSRPQDPTAAAKRIESLVTEFLRILSLAPVAVGRREWVVMQDGVGHLRRLLIELMLEENGIGPAERGGAKKLYPFLTTEQIAELEALVPPRAIEAELLAANRDLRDRFLPRARRVAGQGRDLAGGLGGGGDVRSRPGPARPWLTLGQGFRKRLFEIASLHSFK